MWHPITVIFSTNYKIRNHSGQISFLVNQFPRCLFVHNKIHKIGESCKLGNRNDFLTAQATPLSLTAHFLAERHRRQIAHRNGKSLRLARKRCILPQPKKRSKYKPGLRGRRKREKEINGKENTRRGRKEEKCNNVTI